MNDIKPLKFFVPGFPKPGGSKNAFYIKKLRRAVVTESSNNKDWKSLVKYLGKIEMDKKPLFNCPIHVTAIFILPRPKGHYGTGKNAEKLKESSPLAHISKPDSLKLMRSTEDALTGIVWTDDSLNCALSICKLYGRKPGVFLTIKPLSNADIKIRIQNFRNIGFIWDV